MPASDDAGGLLLKEAIMTNVVSVDLAVPLYPAPGMHRIWDVVLRAQATVNTHLQLLAAGHNITLLEVAGAAREAQATVPLPRLPPHDTYVRVSVPTTNEYLVSFRSVRDAMGWLEVVPASALAWMVRQTLREWRAHVGNESVRVSELPPPWSPFRPVELHVDQGVLLVDGATIEVARVGRVHADVRLLPDPYWGALWSQRQRRLLSEQQRLHRAEQAWLESGNHEASRLALRIRARYQAAGISLDDPVVIDAPHASDLAVTERVVIQRVERPGESHAWQVVWRFRVRAPASPRWTIDDLIGLDPGFQNVVGYASGTLRGVIRRPTGGAWEEPELLPTRVVPVSMQDEARARVAHRLALIERMRPAYAELHALALAHRSVVIEDTDWGAFQRRQQWFGEYAARVGLRTALDHLVALAPLHGVTVQYTRCQYSSSTCSRCTWVGRRARVGARFRCPHCGYTAHADINAASVHRQRSLTGEGRQP
ncbi:zinc ribbon domain-containing protein [Deinococcus malanensis]|uniref:zinc ribbon domain-containing protein n=1 Tax=Deinococcus malanensis TaxID=1706855 RepID=UPI0016635107|nr:zinc ribbon domain-containing protein [Deinococcus malanensis]